MNDSQRLREIANSIKAACSNPAGPPLWVHWSDAESLVQAADHIEDMQRKIDHTNRSLSIAMTMMASSISN